MPSNDGARMLALRDDGAKIENTTENANELARIAEAFDKLYCDIGYTDGLGDDELASLWCFDPEDTFGGFDDKVARIGIDEDATRDLAQDVFDMLPAESQQQLRAIYPEADL